MPVRWSVFDGYGLPSGLPSWDGAKAWTAEDDALLGAERAVVARRRDEFSASIQDIGGDPTIRDWTAFRVLRRDREEDWSDWLANLLEDSVTGQFACALLGAAAADVPSAFAGPRVQREVACPPYRADLLVQWRDASYSHFEIKVGDPDLGKTLTTAKVLESQLRGLKRRHDVLLVLPSQVDAWEVECRNESQAGSRILLRTWLDVARALRSSLPAKAGEPLEWRVWARAFGGAVEQELLGVGAGADADRWAAGLTFQGLATAAKLFGVSGDE